MLKRLVLLSMALLVAVGAAWANDIVLLEPTKVTRANDNNRGELDEIFYLSRTSDTDADYYLGSGAVGDTMCVHFQPLAPCSVYFADQQWNDAGNFQSFVWEYADDCAALYPDGRAPLRGQSPVSPLGDILFGPYNNAAVGNGSWEPLFTSDDLPGGGIWIADGRPFIVGFVKTAGAEPHPLADNIEARGFSYTWFGGPWTEPLDNTWGSYSSVTFQVDMMMRVGVSYPLGAPPIIGSMNQLPDTPNGNKTCTVMCEIVDDNGWTTDTAWLYVQANDEDPMTMQMFDTDPNTEDVFDATFTLDNDYGDVIHYWIEAEDDEGQTNSNEDNQLTFEIIELGQTTADVLYIDHGSNNGFLMYDALWNTMGWYFQYWDAAAHKGIDQYVLSANDWAAVLVTGWGAATVTTRDWDDSPYHDYLMAGGNFFFADQDYFYANGEDENPAFSAGDFAYDVFGIQGGANDPQPTDTTYYGTAGDPISGDFEGDPFMVHFDDASTQSWADGVVGVVDAEDIFFGEDVGNVNGIRYENDFGGRTVFLGFDVEYAVDNTDPENPVMTQQFMDLMTNVVNWFGANGVDEPGTAQPLQFSLAQNYPNPFNPGTQISFTLPQKADVTLSVFNVVGQEVAKLVDGPMNAGPQTVNFDASSLASGVYFYTLTADDFTATRKMMLMK